MQKKVLKAIIPVAGLGTRFLPATKSQPKEMLTIVDKPAIQYIVEEAVASGIRQIFLITSSTKRSIEDYFDYSFELEYRLKKDKKIRAMESIKKLPEMAEFIFIRQKEPKGCGHAVLLAHEFVKNEPCAIMFGDDIIYSRKPCLSQLINVYNKYQDSVVAVKKVSKKEAKHFGSVDVVLLEKTIYQIKKIIEKPKQKSLSNFGVVGRYIVTPDLFDQLLKIKPKRGQEIGMTQALNSLLKQKPVYACEFDGEWYTCGNKQGFLQANIAFGLKHKDTKKELKQFIKKYV